MNLKINCSEEVVIEDAMDICKQNCLIFRCVQDNEQSRNIPIQILEATGNFHEEFSVGICKHMLEHGTEAAHIVHTPNSPFVYKFYSIEWYSRVEPRLQVSVNFNLDTCEVRAGALNHNTVNIAIPLSGDAFKERIAKINMFNKLFGEHTPYTVVGRAMEKTKTGELCYLVVKQPFIESMENSGDEAREKLSKWIVDEFGVNALEGFTQEPSECNGYLEGDWFIKPLQVALDDLKNGNLFIDAKTGKFAVVDCMITSVSYETWIHEMRTNNANSLIPRKRFSFDERGKVVFDIE